MGKNVISSSGWTCSAPTTSGGQLVFEVLYICIIKDQIIHFVSIPSLKAGENCPFKK